MSEQTDDFVKVFHATARHWPEVLTIVKHGLAGNTKGVRDYALFLADQIEAGGDPTTAERFRKIANGDGGAAVRTAAAQAPQAAGGEVLWSGWAEARDGELPERPHLLSDPGQRCSAPCYTAIPVVLLRAPSPGGVEAEQTATAAARELVNLGGMIGALRNAYLGDETKRGRWAAELLDEHVADAAKDKWAMTVTKRGE